VVRRRFTGPRTVVARSPRRPARQAPCVRLLPARSRVSEVRLVAPSGVATGDASDRLLHSETVPTRALVRRRFPARRSPRDALRRRSMATLVPEPRGSVLVRANVSFAASARPSEDARAAHREARGRPMQNEAGENRASRRASHFGDRSILTRWRYLPPCEIDLPTASDTPVASSNPGPARSLFFELTRAGRRPPRPVPRAPRERRALLQSRVPSTDSRHAHPARAEARPRPRSLHPRRGAHVMRIAELRVIRPPFAAGEPVCLRARATPVVRLPFTRSVAATGLSTLSQPVASFSEPEDVLPISANTTMHGHRHGQRGSSFCKGR